MDPIVPKHFHDRKVQKGDILALGAYILIGDPAKPTYLAFYWAGEDPKERAVGSYGMRVWIIAPDVSHALHGKIAWIWTSCYDVRSMHQNIESAFVFGGRAQRTKKEKKGLVVIPFSQMPPNMKFRVLRLEDRPM